MAGAQDLEFARFLASLGVGGVIAGLLFMFYRKDVRSYTDLWQKMSDALLLVVKENTAAITQNTEVVKSLHRRLDRLEGIREGREGA